MSTITNDRITRADMRAALMQIRPMLGDGAFGRSARAEFDGAKDYRDHIADSANDLRKVLERQNGAEARNVRADAMRLVALAEGVNALACLMCNGVMRAHALGARPSGSWTDDDERTEESTRKTLVQTMNAILSFYGAKVASSYGDPRGAVVHIQFTDNSCNRGGNSTVWGL